jgi:hypothetical protein
MAGLAAGGFLVPRVVAGAWHPVLAGIPRFQLSTTPEYGAQDLLLDVEGPIAGSAVSSTAVSPGVEHSWRIATDGQVHYYGRLQDAERLEAVADMVNSTTIPFLNAVHGTSVSTETEVPLEFELDQNYPNPFNPATTIPFVVDRAGPASLRVYDLLGREVAVLADGDLPAGRHEAHWNASGLASGTYLAVLRSASGMRTRRLTLLK